MSWLLRLSVIPLSFAEATACRLIVRYGVERIVDDCRSLERAFGRRLAMDTGFSIGLRAGFFSEP